MEWNRIYHSDFLKLSNQIESKSVNLIIADPPPQEMDMTDNNYREWSCLWIKECLRVLHSQGTLMIYGSTIDNWFMWGMFPKANLRELIWYYPNVNSIKRTTFYQPVHQNILVYLKDPKRNIFNKNDITGNIRLPRGRSNSIQDVLEIGDNVKEKVSGPSGLKHPHQKPLKLTRWLIQGSSNKGHKILVPFSGSGTECLVAHLEGRVFLGFEFYAAYLEMSAMRFRDNGINAEFRHIEGTGVMYIQ